LSRKRTNGQDYLLAVIESNKLDAVQNSLTETCHNCNLQPFLMSKATWDRLNEDKRKIISEAARRSPAFQR